MLLYPRVPYRQRDDSRISVNRDPIILGGFLLFSSTRVPVRALWNHLEAGIQLDEFLDKFHAASQKQAVAVLTSAAEMLLVNSRENIA